MFFNPFYALTSFFVYLCWCTLASVVKFTSPKVKDTPTSILVQLANIFQSLGIPKWRIFILPELSCWQFWQLLEIMRSFYIFFLFERKMFSGHFVSLWFKTCTFLHFFLVVSTASSSYGTPCKIPGKPTHQEKPKLAKNLLVGDQILM